MSKFSFGEEMAQKILLMAEKNPEVMSRLIRAKEQGYDVNRVWLRGVPRYKNYGENQILDAISAEQHGLFGHGPYFADSAATANEYSNPYGRIVANPKGVGEAMLPTYLKTGDPMIMTDRSNSGDINVWNKIYSKSGVDTSPSSSNKNFHNYSKLIEAKIAEEKLLAKERGYRLDSGDESDILNSIDRAFGETQGERGIIIDKDVKSTGRGDYATAPQYFETTTPRIRSIFAKFDPDLKDSLLINNAIAPIGGAFLRSVSENPVETLSKLYRDEYKPWQIEATKPLRGFVKNSFSIGENDYVGNKLIPDIATELIDPLNYAPMAIQAPIQLNPHNFRK